jgi:predicted GNAT family acetyltransferase
MDALDNPIWNALTGAQQGFAYRRGDAAHFAHEVTRLAGLREPTAAACADLALLLPEDRRTGLFLEASIPTAALVIDEKDDLLQMVHDGRHRAAPTDTIVELGPADHVEMRALAELTQPGPFGTRTHELGTFLGIRIDGALAAMAGQRMRMPGEQLIEVSAICTHPRHAGRGLAAQLTRAIVARVLDAQAIPFLHVRSSNTRAIALYERLGFRTRRTFRYVIVRRK